MDRKLVYGSAAVIIVIVLIVSIVFVVPMFEKPKKELVLATYEKASSTDLLNNSQNHVYFISWIGCPVGADNSWVLYSLLNQTTNGNASKDVILHESIAHTPGLLFLKGSSYDNLMENISFKCAGVPFLFTSIYMYNQTLKGTVYNQSIGSNSSDKINAGLAVLKSNLPASVYNLAKEYQTVIPEKNQTKSIAELSGHLVTMVILTGPDGTYVHFWFMYPSFGSTVSPLTVFQQYRTYDGGIIINAESPLLKALGGANVACA